MPVTARLIVITRVISSVNGFVVYHINKEMSDDGPYFNRTAIQGSRDCQPRFSKQSDKIK